MKKISPRILFFGNERLATGVTTDLPVLNGLVEAGFEVAAIITAQKPMSSSRNSKQLEIIEAAQQLDIPILTPDNLADARDQLVGFQADIGVLVAYGKIVPQSIIDLFPSGIINLHPSLLPAHRGPTPIESCILAGEHQTGASLMQLSAAMDAGPVYLQTSISLTGNESKQALADQLGRIGAEKIIGCLPEILSGKLQPTPQASDGISYDDKLSKDMSELDFNKPAKLLEREIRALAGWPRSRTTIYGTNVVITAARVVEGAGSPGSAWNPGKRFGFYTSEDILAIDTLIPEGKTEMSIEAFLAGYNRRDRHH